MKKFLDILKNNALFKGIEPADLENILDCLIARVVSYEKNDTVIHYGDEITSVGIVLSGGIQVIKEDMTGNVNILTKLGAGEVFAEAFASAGVAESPVMVQAVEACEIMYVKFERIVTSCTNACTFHTRLVENMLGLLARKNILLNQKIEIMSKRTIREKLLMFFDTQKSISHSNKIKIPYNREALAQYLCVDRSAMSRELCKMRDEGLLRFRKNEFEIR